MRKPARPRYADVASTLALLLALGGSAYAATALAPDSVGSAEIRTDAVGASEIKAAAVGHAELAPNAVTGADVAPESVTLADILGANVTGKMSFSIGIWDCWRVDIGVPGAKAGQVALFSFTDTTPLPEGISTSAPTVSEGKVALQFCHGDTAADTPAAIQDKPFRVVTFG